MAGRGSNKTVMIYVTTLGQTLMGETGERSAGSNFDLEAIVLHNPRMCVTLPQDIGSPMVAFPPPSPFFLRDQLKLHRSNIVLEWEATKKQAEMYRSEISNIIMGDMAMDLAAGLPNDEE